MGTKLKNMIPFTIIQINKYLGLHLTEYVWDQYTRSYKALMKEIRFYNLRIWRDKQAHNYNAQTGTVSVLP